MKCKQCGAEIENSRCCPYCGSENADYDAAADAIQQDEARQNIPGHGRGREVYDSDKSKMVTFLLALFSGPLGLHNFYTGRWGRALFYMVTMGFLMFGWLYDLFMIATNKFKDANGDYIVR